MDRAFGSDGEYTVVVYKDGRARYDANAGADRVSVGTSGVTGCSVSGDMILLTYGSKGSRRYDVRTGTYRGSA